MKKNLIRLISAVTAASTIIGSSIVGVAAEEKNDNISSENTVKVNVDNNSNNLEKIQTKTTGAGVEVTESDIPKEISDKYESYLSDNSIKNIDDLVDIVYGSLDDVDVKDNPNFSKIESGKQAYEILKELKESSLIEDKDKKNEIREAVGLYNVYVELAKDNGFIFNTHTGSDDFSTEFKEYLADFIIKYNYNDATLEKFKSDLEKTLSEKFNDTFTIAESEDDSVIINPTTSSTGYAGIFETIKNSKNHSIDISFEKVLKKLASSNNTTSSGSSSSHHSGGGSGSSSSSSSSSDDNKTTENTTVEETTNTETNTTAVNVITDINGIVKLTDINGQALTGWQSVNGAWYLADVNGQALTGWQNVNGAWYLLEETGVMKTGWYKDTDGRWYLLQESGAMKRGWYKDTNGKWYLLQGSGSMATGWYKDTNGKWYYLNSDGSMAHDTYVDGYYVNSNGEWV